MYSSLLVEQAGSAYSKNEKTTVAQPAVGPTVISFSRENAKKTVEPPALGLIKCS